MKIFPRSGLFANHGSRNQNSPQPKRFKRGFAARPGIEMLEDRLVPATFTVNTLADTVDANPAVTSLREAITAANSQAGDDIINFSVTGTINLNTWLPLLTSNIQVQGPGAASLTVRRNTGGDYAIFSVFGPTVGIDGMTISNGFVHGFGGGIYNAGTLTVSNSTLSGNSAYALGDSELSFGGGIYNAGTLTVSNSTLSGNSVYGVQANSGPGGVGGLGGGIYNRGTLTVSYSILSDNSAAGQYGFGGGISNGLLESGTLTISNTTLLANSASASGGGIANGGTLTVSNTTLLGNSAGYSGGGIDNGGTLTVSNSTLSSNTANIGGGIDNEGGALRLNNTIVANSTLGGDVVNSAALTGSHNLIEDGSGGLPDTITGDPNLGPLADNGGPTLTCALLAGSPAIDAGDNRLAVDSITGRTLTTDQRGSPYARINGGQVDIGAFESPGPAVIGPDPLDPSHTALFVIGTAGNDSIIINSAQQGITVKINGTAMGTFEPTGRIIVYGMAGDDDIQVAGGITNPCWLYGGDGNDRLKGGSGNNVLLGGAGDDLLVGGSNRDILIGGAGADRIVGNEADDILIAGTTAFDADDPALSAVLAEWTSARSYGVRVANIMGTGTGSDFANRNNGSYFLRVTNDAATTTVFDDGSQDTLTGSTGQDWFFANLLGAGAKDKITDLSAAEFANDLTFILAP